MKKNYFLLVLLIGALNISFGQIWSENFDSYTDGTGIEGVTGNVGDYPAGVTKWSLDVSAAVLTATFSAPHLNKSFTSSIDLIPPPTVMGT